MKYQSAYLLINGERRTRDRETLDVIDPARGEVIGAVPVATADDLDEALQASEQGFAAWRAVTPFERSRTLKRAAQLLRDRADGIAPQMTLEQGKTLREAKGEVLATAEVIEWHAEEARRSYGRVIATTVPSGRGLVVREPVGPVAAFSPWNLPAFMPGRKMAAALAAGCACIIKPAEETPLSALHVAEAFLDAGVPATALSVVYGRPAAISARLVTARQVRKVSFTGSVRVGREIARIAADHVKRVTMELGGHAPTIVHEDADLEAAAMATARSKFANAGQICVSPTRFYVHERVHDKFVEHVLDYARTLKVGNGLDETTTMGPMANARRLEAMERLTRDAIARGGELRLGGGRIGERGFFWEPTVVTRVPEDAMVMNEEPFGPLLVTSTFTDDDEVLQRANRLEFGLASFCFTRSQARASRMSAGLAAGLVGLNTTMVAFPEAPFGGIKESGYGSEGGHEALDAYLTTKFIHQA